MDLQLLIKLKIKTDITDYFAMKKWESMSETAISLPNIHFSSFSNRVLGWKPMSASLADQQDRTGICISRTFKKSFFVYFCFLPYLQCGHLICSSGSSMGTLSMDVKDDRAKTQNKYTPQLILWNSHNISSLPASCISLYKK